MVFHPYKISDEIDSYYADLADNVFNIIKDSEISDAFDDDMEKMKKTAIRLTMWFEDVISDIGIWKAVKKEFKERYGYKLPFFKLYGCYYDDFINTQDVSFLMWNEVQSLHEETLICHYNPSLLKVSQDIYDLFYEEWNYSPVNERLHEYIHGEWATASYWNARKLMEWFYDFSFVSTHSESDLIESCKDFGRRDSEYYHQMFYYAHVENVFCHKRNLLSLTVSQLIARVRDEKEFDFWENIKWRNTSAYQYVGADDDTIIVKDLVYEDELRIEKESFNDTIARREFKTDEVLTCSVVTCDDKNYQCGMMRISTLSNSRNVVDDLKKKKSVIDSIEMMYYRFMKIFGRDTLVVGTKEEIDEVNAMLGVGRKDVLFEDNCIIFCTPTLGVHYVPDYGECIKEKNNKYYDKKVAKEYAHHFYYGNEMIEYRKMCDLHEGGLLSDAHINNDFESDSVGRMLVNKYGSFIIDYFHSKTKKYDYDAKLKLQNINI